MIMEESTIIKSEQYKVDGICKIIILIGTAAFIFCAYYCGIINNEFERLFRYGIIPDDLFKTCPICLAVILLAILAKYWLSSYEMVVTNKRVYGKVAWGKRVDLPFDSISATSTIRVFNGLSVSTSSGKINFLLIKNANEMYEEINKLLIERQQMKESTAKQPEESKTDVSNDLIKLKELLNKDIITQEEFDAKKKQILGL